MDVEAWLQRLGMQQYASAFRENAIDADVLARLTAEDLKEIGVVAVGHRRKMLDAISALGAEPAPSSVAPAPAPAHIFPRPKNEAERRPITVMFCDLVGSTSMAAAMDAEDWRELVGAYLDEAAKSVTQYGGHVLKKLGDGLMALFGYPKAQENDAERAARAGLAILRALETLNAKNAARGLPPLAARIGLQSGPVVVDSSGEVFGDAPNVAARVQAAAEPGTLFVTALVQRQVAGFFVAEEKGPHELKGVTGKPVLYRLARVSGGGRKAGARALTVLVGREEELATLARRWERANAGDGQFMQIVGEPGLGKSRLLDEFRIRLADTPHTWVEWSSSQLLQNTPLHPLLEWGQQRFVGDSKFAELEAALAQVKLDPAEHAPLLALLLDIPTPDGRAPQLAADELRRRQLAAVVAWLLAGARAQPLVLAFEDLHWADPTTLDLMKTLVERGGQARLFIVATARPEFRASWTTRSHHGVISLSPLDRAQIGQMVATIAARHALSKDLVAGLSDRTGGVPLFIEELTRLMLEGGAQTVPPSLQQSLAARLDRLGDAREVAQIGAVLGREFSHALLASVAELPGSVLEAAIEKLAETDLLFVDGVAPSATYRFKHALIQDAAYDSLLKARRQALHARTAETLAASAKPQPELIAHHFTQSGKVEQAIEWWGRAGDEALRRSSFQEAAAHLGKAIELADGVQTPQTARLRSEHRRAVMWSSGQWSDRAEAALESTDAEPQAEDRGATYYSDIIILMARHWALGDRQATMLLGENVSRQVKRLTECGKVRWANTLRRMIGLNQGFLGEWQAAYATLTEVAAYFDGNPDGDDEPLGVMDDQAMASSYLMCAAWQVGKVAEAIARNRSAVARASALGHLATIVNVQAVRMMLLCEALDPEALLSDAEKLFKAAEQLGSPYFLLPARMIRTYAAGLEREPSAAAAQLRLQLNEYMGTGARFFAPMMYGRLAELAMLGKEWLTVGTTIEEGIKLVEGGCDSYAAPYLHRLLGAFSARFDPPDMREARRALKTSIDVASAQGARSERLLSALALARLPSQSPEDLWEARQTLAAAFEGFETETEFPAVAEAQTLLAALEVHPEVVAARERTQEITKIRSAYRRAVAWGDGQWSEPTTSQIGTETTGKAHEEGAAHYSDLMLRMTHTYIVGDVQAGVAAVQEAFQNIKLLEQRGKVRWARSLQRVLGASQLFLGEAQAAYTTLKGVVEYFNANPDADDEPLGVMDDQANAASYLMWAAWQVGALGEALAYGRNALARALAINHRGTITNYYVIRLILCNGHLDPKNLLQEAERLLEWAEPLGAPMFTYNARMLLSYAAGLEREPSVAVIQLRAQLTEYMGVGARVGAPSTYGHIAELEMLAKNWANAEVAIKDGLQLVESGCDPFAAPYLYRLLGDYHARRDMPKFEEARNALKASIDIASTQGARSERLLSALALARLPHQSPADLLDARRTLFFAHDGFASETEFPAVVEAQSILAELEEAAFADAK